MIFWNFKTSHVIVYLIASAVCLSSSFISKHLMLLFIGCSISAKVRYGHFKTSHVIVYRKPDRL